MTLPQLTAVFALLLTVQAAVNQPGNNGTVVSAGFGTNLIDGLSRLVSKITKRDNMNVTSAVSNATATSTNGTGVQPAVVCPPPRPDLQVNTSVIQCSIWNSALATEVHVAFGDKANELFLYFLLVTKNLTKRNYYNTSLRRLPPSGRQE
jgi:hypothetical protein